MRRHNGAQLKHKIVLKEPVQQMPSLIRFLIIIGVLGGVTFGGLYYLAEFAEPETKETVSTVPGGVKIRK
jgi:hypothetical protein